MNTEKLQHHQGLVIIPLESGQSVELSPQECWRLTERIRSYLFGNYNTLDPMPLAVIHKHKKSFNVVITEHIPFWKKVNKGRWEPQTFKIFDHFLSADCIYLDIGAWIGPTALYAAQLAKHVYAFEPDPLAYQELEANVSANKSAEWEPRLSIYNKAIAASSGTIKLGSRKHGGDSMSSVLFADQNISWEVSAITLQQFIEAKKLQNEKLFIKIDIEGGEYSLIPGIKSVFSQHNVALYLSIHPSFLRESLIQKEKVGLLYKASQRLTFVKQQIKLLHSLPFKYLYNIDGQRINRYKQIFKALLLGDFIHEIVATNTKWENIQN